MINLRGTAAIIGQRIRVYRKELKLSQEQLAEKCGLHPTYIGQLERGEKNASIETVGKISSALGVSMSVLFEKINETAESEHSLPLDAYNLMQELDRSEQEELLGIMKAVIRYRKL